MLYAFIAFGIFVYGCVAWLCITKDRINKGLRR